ncbi:integrase core domain-containing protein [Hymenobacter cavernae]|uniref:integrase core domain-containing protein n=1 Tax=Hymenobacter cavernae TaxID=2044852 RepID=UPI00166480EE
MSRRGDCYENAHAESFWSRLKPELLDEDSFANLKEARLQISHYIAYHNAEQRHSAFGYCTFNYFAAQLQTTSPFCPALLDHLTFRSNCISHYSLTLPTGRQHTAINVTSSSLFGQRLCNITEAAGTP